MKGFIYTLPWSLSLLLASANAGAGYLGTLETGVSNFENVQAVANEPQSFSDRSYYAAGYVTAFHAMNGDRTAVLGKLSLRHEEFQDSQTLTNDTFGGDVGIYHLLKRGDSVLATVGGRSVQFEDARRDDTITSARMTYNLKLHPRWQLGTELVYERGSQDTMSGRYEGQGVASSLNWTAHRVVRLMLGIGYNANAFERQLSLPGGKRQAVSKEEQSMTGWLGMAVAFSDQIYGVASISRRQLESDGAEPVLGDTYSFALGTRF